MHQRFASFLVPSIFLAICFSDSASAADPTAALTDCARIVENKARLSCYDHLAERVLAPEPQQSVEPGEEVRNPPPPEAIAAAKEVESEPFSLAKHWELDQAHKRGTFAFRPHNQNYLILANHTRDPNDGPYEPFASVTHDTRLAHTEIGFQLGFKMKMLENIVNGSDLWFGYTQRSFWQAYNSAASSPFRDTNYEPEVMFVMPVNHVNVLGMHMRFVNVGLVHQSNGQSSSLSRSWNRAYVQTGLERGNFSLLARAWYRFHEDPSTDDNPGITDYLGHGDLVANYRWRDNDFSALVRHNFSTNKGALQLSWGFPLTEKLKGFVRFFSGYGETLIDYNSYQQSVGLGFLVDF